MFSLAWCQNLHLLPFSLCAWTPIPTECVIYPIWPGLKFPANSSQYMLKLCRESGLQQVLCLLQAGPLPKPPNALGNFGQQTDWPPHPPAV